MRSPRWAGSLRNHEPRLQPPYSLSCFGEKIGTLDTDEECWEVTGHLRDIYYTAILPKLLERLFVIFGAASIADWITLPVYMVGHHRTDALPTVMVCSEDETACKKAKKEIKKSGLLKRHAKFRVMCVSEDPGMQNMEQLASESEAGNTETAMRSMNVLVDTSKPLQPHGMEVWVDHGSSLRPTTAFLSEIDGDIFLRTVHHAFVAPTLPKKPTSAIQKRPVHVYSDSDSDSDSDFESGDDDDLHIAITSIGSKSPDTWSDSGSHSGSSFASTLPSGGSTPNTGHPSRMTPTISTDLQEVSSRLAPLQSFSPSYPPKQIVPPSKENLIGLGRLAFWSKDKDWALIDITNEELKKTLNQALPCDFTTSKPLPGPKDDAEVVAFTSSGGMLSGQFSGTPFYTRLPNSTSFQEVYRVRLVGALANGDCGSAVRDAYTGELYGHIVAGCRATGTAYIMAAHQVEADFVSLDLDSKPILDRILDQLNTTPSQLTDQVDNCQQTVPECNHPAPEEAPLRQSVEDHANHVPTPVRECINIVTAFDIVTRIINLVTRILPVIMAHPTRVLQPAPWIEAFDSLRGTFLDVSSALQASSRVLVESGQDLAGGTPVHICAGCATLAYSLLRWRGRGHFFILAGSLALLIALQSKVKIFQILTKLAVSLLVAYCFALAQNTILTSAYAKAGHPHIFLHNSMLSRMAPWKPTATDFSLTRPADKTVFLGLKSLVASLTTEAQESAGLLTPVNRAKTMARCASGPFNTSRNRPNGIRKGHDRTSLTKSLRRFLWIYLVCSFFLGSMLFSSSRTFLSAPDFFLKHMRSVGPNLVAILGAFLAFLPSVILHRMSRRRKKYLPKWWLLTYLPTIGFKWSIAVLVSIRLGWLYLHSPEPFWCPRFSGIPFRIGQLAGEFNFKDNALWMIISTMLVLLMTLILAMFYAGLAPSHRLRFRLWLVVGPCLVVVSLWGYSLVDFGWLGHLPQVEPSLIDLSRKLPPAQSPGALLLAYLILGAITWTLVLTLAEMGITFPSSPPLQPLALIIRACGLLHGVNAAFFSLIIVFSTSYSGYVFQRNFAEALTGILWKKRPHPHFYRRTEIPRDRDKNRIPWENESSLIDIDQWPRHWERLASIAFVALVGGSWTHLISAKTLVSAGLRDLCSSYGTTPVLASLISTPFFVRMGYGLIMSYVGASHDRSKRAAILDATTAGFDRVLLSFSLGVCLLMAFFDPIPNDANHDHSWRAGLISMALVLALLGVKFAFNHTTIGLKLSIQQSAMFVKLGILMALILIVVAGCIRGSDRLSGSSPQHISNDSSNSETLEALLSPYFFLILLAWLISVSERWVSRDGMRQPRFGYKDTDYLLRSASWPVLEKSLLGMSLHHDKGAFRRVGSFPSRRESSLSDDGSGDDSVSAKHCSFGYKADTGGIGVYCRFFAEALLSAFAFAVWLWLRNTASADQISARPAGPPLSVYLEAYSVPMTFILLYWVWRVSHQSCDPRLETDLAGCWGVQHWRVTRTEEVKHGFRQYPYRPRMSRVKSLLGFVLCVSVVIYMGINSFLLKEVENWKRMSFGFAIGDIIHAAQIARHVRETWFERRSRADDRFLDFGRDLAKFQTLLTCYQLQLQGLKTRQAPVDLEKMLYLARDRTEPISLLDISLELERRVKELEKQIAEGEQSVAEGDPGDAEQELRTGPYKRLVEDGRQQLSQNLPFRSRTGGGWTNLVWSRCRELAPRPDQKILQLEHRIKELDRRFAEGNPDDPGEALNTDNDTKLENELGHRQNSPAPHTVRRKTLLCLALIFVMGINTFLLKEVENWKREDMKSLSDNPSIGATAALYDEPIAVVGMAARIPPMATEMESLWRGCLESDLKNDHFPPSDPHFRPRQFRILRITPHAHSGLPGEKFLEVTRMDPVERFLDSSPHFEALSYCWGNATTKHPIITVGKRRTSRKTSAVKNDSALWADAICISEYDNQARNRQTRTMCDIYKTTALHDSLQDVHNSQSNSDIAGGFHRHWIPSPYYYPTPEYPSSQMGSTRSLDPVIDGPLVVHCEPKICDLCDPPDGARPAPVKSGGSNGTKLVLSSAPSSISRTVDYSPWCLRALPPESMATMRYLSDGLTQISSEWVSWWNEKSKDLRSGIARAGIPPFTGLDKETSSGKGVG